MQQRDLDGPRLLVPTFLASSFPLVSGLSTEPSVEESLEEEEGMAKMTFRCHGDMKQNHRAMSFCSQLIVPALKQLVSLICCCLSPGFPGPLEPLCLLSSSRSLSDRRIPGCSVLGKGTCHLFAVVTS